MLLVLAGGARAESPAETEARERYNKAQKLADRAEWAEALGEFERSYALTHYPAILYRIALCQEQLRRPADALASYRKYLEDDPKSERRAGVEAKIRELERELAPPVAPANVVVVTPHPAPPPRTPVYRRWWLWTVVGVAAAGTALGVGLGVGLSNRFDADLGSFGPGLGGR
jgi:tetratricopeptide (TPR) repeat protein